MLGLRTDRGIPAEWLDAGSVERDGLEVAGDLVRIPEEKFFVSDSIIARLV